MKNYLFIVFILFFSCSESDDEIVQNVDSVEIKGVDISFLPDIRQHNVILYNQQNNAEDMLQILKNAGVNTARIRLWKQPTENISDFNTVKNLAAECKSLGLKVLLSVHYSDFWADPANQNTPIEWNEINFNQLTDSVFSYTKKIVAEMNPEYIQIGNEINSGFLWPSGNISNLLQMKTLLNRAAQAVRETNASTKIIIHYAGYENADYFFEKITDVDYDIIGLSYYPIWHGKNLAELENILFSLSETFNKKVIIAETSYPFTFGWNDWTNNVIGSENQILDEFPATAIGQKDFVSKIKDIAKNNENCLGFCYWGGEWISYKGNSATDGSTWENQAFWDFSNRALPVLDNY